MKKADSDAIIKAQMKLIDEQAEFIKDMEHKLRENNAIGLKMGNVMRNYSSLIKTQNSRVDKLKEALCFYANFPYEKGLAYVKKENAGSGIDFNDPDSTAVRCKYTYDKGDVAKKALGETE